MIQPELILSALMERPMAFKTSKTLFVTSNHLCQNRTPSKNVDIIVQGLGCLCSPFMATSVLKTNHFHHCAFIMDPDFAQDLKLLMAADERLTGGYRRGM